jgi:hypothetical protein
MQDSENTDERTPSAIIVTCMESGHLESQTLRMIQSVRNWGGRFAQFPVYAVTPRFGPPLQKTTLKSYDRLNVTHLRVKADSNYAWYNFTNKPAALLAAEAVKKVDQVIWLDADLLVVSEPADVLLKPGEDFTACPTEKNVATTGPDDPYNGYWLAMCEAVGIAIDDIPYVTEFRSQQRIRMYFNSGVFTYRPETGLAEAYRQATERLMDARIQLPKDKIFYHEQSAVGLAAVKNKLRIRMLSESCNYHLGSMTLEHVVPEKFRSASILHYHRSMQPDRWKQFLPLIQTNDPAVGAWLAPQGPLQYRVTPWKQAVNKWVRFSRKRSSDAYLAACRTV